MVASPESAVEAATVALDKVKAESTAEISAREARLNFTRGARGRQTTLPECNVAATAKVDAARADFQMSQQDLAMAQLNRRVAEIELQRARAPLEQRAIRSPIDGFVVLRALGPGQYVHQDASIMTLAQIDPPRSSAIPMPWATARFVVDSPIS